MVIIMVTFKEVENQFNKNLDEILDSMIEILEKDLDERLEREIKFFLEYTSDKEGDISMTMRFRIDKFYQSLNSEIMRKMFEHKLNDLINKYQKEGHIFMKLNSDTKDILFYFVR